MKRYFLFFGIFFPLFAFSQTHSEEQQRRGRILFQNNCASCHNINKELTGPPLRDISYRLTFNKFYAYVTNPDSSTIKNDSYFRRLHKKYNMPHAKFPGLRKPELQALYAYLKNAGSMPQSAPDKIVDSNIKKEKPVNVTFARFYFTIDSTMLVGNTYEANLNLSSSYDVIKENLEKIIEQTHPSKIVADSIKLETKYIDARLTDLSASENPTFSIKEIGEVPVRRLEDSAALDWKWSVSPLRGNTSAVLYLNIMLYTEKGTDTDSTFLTRTNNPYKITVIAEEKSTWSKVTSFIGANWQYFGSAIIIPLIAFLYKIFFANRQQANNTKQKKKK